MYENGVKNVMMEVSSHALEQNRTGHCAFSGAVLTNLTQDHLDYHITMNNYFEAKAILFKNLQDGAFAVINKDDEYSQRFIDVTKKGTKIYTYGVKNDADVTAKNIEFSIHGATFDCNTPKGSIKLNLQLNGMFSVYNALAAIGVANIFSVDAENLKAALENIAVPGRSELVPNKKDLTIMIDYAHSPASLESILKAVKGYTRGRVISVFGCGGDRDKTKRPIMGKISGEIAGFTIITTDNPRTENPEKIVKDIEEGIKQTKGQYTVIVDRTEAIKQAIKMANKNDIIVLTGKGHETYQEINGEKLPYDERKIIKQIIG